MVLGLSLILIVVLPYCAYLYYINKKLEKEIKQLTKEKIEILERKIKNNQAQDIVPLSYIKQSITTNQEKEEQNKHYLEEISNKLNDSIQVQPIELTEYEQEQENNAIISYQELKAHTNENTENQYEREETKQFINNLKQLRDHLKND